MKPLAQTAAFTLAEALVGTGILALIIVLAAQFTAGTLNTVSQSAYRLDSSEAMRAASAILRTELASAVACDREGRHLNLRIVEDDQSVTLYFTTPRTDARSLVRMGFVTHAAYVWNKEKRILARAEYHSARDEKAVAKTAASKDGANMTANVSRLGRITPAYQSADPYAWIDLPIWEDRIKEAMRKPLLTGVTSWKIHPYETTQLDHEKPEQNRWIHSKRIPAVLKMELILQAAPGGMTPETAGGRPYTILIPLRGSEGTP